LVENLLDENSRHIEHLNPSDSESGTGDFEGDIILPRDVKSQFDNERTLSKSAKILFLTLWSLELLNDTMVSFTFR